MEHEPIWMDGVDVSGCSVYKNGKCLISKAKCNARCDYGAIYLKEQLARKMQECEELKKQLMQKDEVNTFFNTPTEGWSNNPCDICGIKNNHEQLKEDYTELEHRHNEAFQDFERIKQKYEHLQEKYEALELENQEGYEIVDELKQECDTLKSQLDFEVQQKECIEQECEALKKRNEDNERFYLIQYAKKDSEVLDLTHKLNVKTQECEELKKQLKTSEKWRVKSESLNEKLDIENTRYRKALEEIENIAAACFMAAKYEDRPYSGQILDIINKAKGEEK